MVSALPSLCTFKICARRVGFHVEKRYTIATVDGDHVEKRYTIATVDGDASDAAMLGTAKADGSEEQSGAGARRTSAGEKEA